MGAAAVLKISHCKPRRLESVSARQNTDCRRRLQSAIQLRGGASQDRRKIADWSRLLQSLVYSLCEDRLPWGEARHGDSIRGRHGHHLEDPAQRVLGEAMVVGKQTDGLLEQGAQCRVVAGAAGQVQYVVKCLCLRGLDGHVEVTSRHCLPDTRSICRSRKQCRPCSNTLFSRCKQWHTEGSLTL